MSLAPEHPVEEVQRSSRGQRYRQPTTIEPCSNCQACGQQALRSTFVRLFVADAGVVDPVVGAPRDIITDVGLSYCMNRYFWYVDTVLSDPRYCMDSKRAAAWGSAVGLQD